MFPSLRHFLEALDADGQLRRVRVPVDPRLEITEVVQRMVSRPAARASGSAAAFDPDHAGFGGHALLFEQVRGCDFPVAINLFGSYRRMEMALGVAEHPRGLEALADRIAALVRPEPPRSLGELVRLARRMAPLLRIPPRSVRRGRCQEVIRLTERGEVDLRRLPLLRCWPLDGDPQAVGYPWDATRSGTAAGEGRYVTFAGMHTIHADDRGQAKPASHNIGMYRAQLLGPTSLAMHWHMHHDGARHWRSWRERGEPMPVAICLGGESVLPYAATAPLPPGVSELLMAGFLNGRGIPMVPAATVPLRVPASSEIVIEGWIDPRAGFPGWEPREGGEPLGEGAVFEGPFGDHTGFYSLPDRYPVVRVSAVTHARDAVFPATVVGLPPQEDYYLGKATERIFLPLLRTLVPDVEDYHLPRFGCFHNAAWMRIRKAYPLQARRVMHSVWGAGQMAWTKTVVVVDDATPLHREEEVWRTLFRRCRFDRDVELVHGPLDILDHAAPRLGAGCKIGFDATGAIAGEEVHGVPLGDPPQPGAASAAVAALLGRLRGLALPDGSRVTEAAAPEMGAGRCVFLSVEKKAAGAGALAVESLWRLADAAGAGAAGMADFAVIVDDGTPLRDWERVFFLMCANADPGRDAHRSGARIAFDATTKVEGRGADGRHGEPVRRYPPILRMDDATRRLVDGRWREYGLEP